MSSSSLEEVPCLLVTGAGGPAGTAVIEALKRAKIRTVAVDCDADSAGMYLADASAVVPRYTEPHYLESLLSIAAEHRCDGVISTMSEELLVLGPLAHRFTAEGLATWFPDVSAVAACVDKWSFAQFMVDGGVQAPITALGHLGGVPGPWVIKPRFGRGSQNVYMVEHSGIASVVLGLVPDPIVQQRLSGREFTADCLIDRDGTVRCIVPRWRTQTRGGISTKGTTFRDHRVVDLVTAAVAALGLTGCCNVQGFVDEVGPAKIVEINPRFSGGLPLSLAAGADLVGQYVRAMFGEPIDDAELQWRPGVSLVRYFADIFLEGGTPLSA